MALLNLPEPFAKVDELAEQGDLDGARAALAATGAKSPLTEICEVKIGLLDGSLKPQIAMNRLLALMRADSDLLGAHDLYKEASQMSYQSGRSSMAHSHPPPPMKPGDEH